MQHPYCPLGVSNVTTDPPFILLVLPLDTSPAILKLPDSSFDATMKTGKYTLDELPLKSEPNLS